MSLSWYICHESDIRLWGLTSKERMRRMLNRLGIHDELSDLQHIPTDSSVLIMRGDFIFDERALRSLSKEKNAILDIETDAGSIPVAAHVEASVAPSVFRRDTSGAGCRNRKLKKSDLARSR